MKKAKAPRVLRYMFQGHRFDASGGWYEVPAGTAQQLRELHQDHYDPDSPLIFDVVTRDQAEKLEESERIEEEHASAERPHRVRSRLQQRVAALTTKDLAGTQPEMIDPDPDGEEITAVESEDSGLAKHVGRLSSPTPGRRRRSGSSK